MEILCPPPLNKKVNKNQGFTLIELSVALVIISLIVGGVLVGQDLIKAAQLRSVITAKEKLETQINAFRLKYNGLPGDLKNATSFWGTDTNCSDAYTSSTPKAETCNGDGNGRLALHTPGLSIERRFETYRFWQHLANSKIIEATYTGTPTGTSGDLNWELDKDLNAPEMGKEDVYFHAQTLLPSTSRIFDSSAGNAFLAIQRNSGTGAFNASELRQIDSKIDDGKPFSGRVSTYKTAPCVTAVDVTADYLTSEEERNCIGVFTGYF